jgi:hypothetical protein
MYHQLPGSTGKVFGAKLSGKVTRADFQQFVPVLEHLIRHHGKARVLFELADLKGFELAAMWEDIAFDVKHHADIERCAVVGDKKWEEWLVQLCKPFYSAQIKYFDIRQIDDAWAWIKEGT